MKYELNHIYCADCYEAIKDVPDKSVDLIVTDPPYMFSTGGKMTGIFKDRSTRHFDALEDTGLTMNYDYARLLPEFIRVMKKINIYIWCNKEQIKQYLDFFIGQAYKPKYERDDNTAFEMIVWNKTNPIPLVNNRYLPDKEYCLFFKERGVKLNGSYETKKTVYYEQANVADKEKFEHPTIKPLHIIQNLIINSSDVGDIVLDPFMGSGTTAVACKNLGRQFIGFEVNPKWHKIACDRLNNTDASGQLSLFTM